MVNLLNGELFKLQKSSSFFVCCITAIVFIILMYGGIKMIEEFAKQDPNASVAEYLGLEEGEPFGIINMEEIMLSSIAVLLPSFFACIFVNEEYGNGAIKNMIGKGVAREKVFLAKYLITIFATILIFLMIFFVTLLCGILFMGTDGLNGEFVQKLCQYGGMKLLFEIAFVSVVILVGEFSRNIGISMAINLVLIMLAGSVFIGLDALLSLVNVSFEISDYWIGNLVAEFSVTDMHHDVVVQGFTAVIFWIMVALIGGIFHIKTADVK